MKLLPTKSIPFQNIPLGTSATSYVDKLVLFLEGSLPEFPVEKKLKKETNENDLTEELYKFLTRKARLSNQPFEFQPEKSQKVTKGHDKRVDLAVRINTCDINMEIIFCIEAKKLPTDRPNGQREKEYALGAKGGIERFKNEAHGKDDTGKLLPRNGIVAYVTNYGFHHWLTEVNNWISNAGWPSNEFLIIDFTNKIAKLSSKHTCTSGGMVELTHFWIEI